MRKKRRSGGSKNTRGKFVCIAEAEKLERLRSAKLGFWVPGQGARKKFEGVGASPPLLPLKRFQR